MSSPAVTPLILQPGEAAARLGLTRADLVAIIRRRQYGFTEIKPGGKPGDRGPNRWGLTEAQIAAIVRGQAKVLPDPAGSDKPDRIPASTNLSPDGKSRLPRIGRARM